MSTKKKPARKAPRKKVAVTKAPAKKSSARKHPIGKQKTQPAELRLAVSLVRDYLSVQANPTVREPRTIVLYLVGDLSSGRFLSMKSRRKGFDWKHPKPRRGNFSAAQPGASANEVQVVDNHVDLDVEWHYRLAVRWNNKTYFTDMLPTNYRGARPLDRPGDPIIINKKARRV